MKQNSRIYYSAASEKGSREKNQDNLGITGAFPWAQVEEPFSCSGQIDLGTVRIFSVCDGIGGAAMGELASRNALLGVQKYLQGMQDETVDLRQLLLGAAEFAQMQVQAMYKRLRCEGGCTLTMLAIREDSYAFLNVGDSPAFLLSGENGELKELSQCHNLAAMKARRGLAVGRGDEHRLVYYLGRASGVAEMAYVSGGELRQGDQFLLCSDGVTNALSPDALRDLMRREIPAGEMVRMAAQTRGSDNCTAIHLKLTA